MNWCEYQSPHTLVKIVGMPVEATSHTIIQTTLPLIHHPSTCDLSCQLGKLGWVASKLATKQTLRLASKELERVGGVTGLVWLAGEGVLWTAWHPIEATMTGVGLVADAGRSLYDRALWVGDLLATVREETFAGPVVDA